MAGLLASGLSDREIAARLVVTPRTVATHVGHILARLGLRSRTELATWAVERGLRPSVSGGARARRPAAGSDR